MNLRLLRTSVSIPAAFLTLPSSLLRPAMIFRPFFLNSSSMFLLGRFSEVASEANPSERMISCTTKCRTVVFPSVPFTSANFNRASSLKALASPWFVPTFIRFPVLRTASRSLRNSLLLFRSSQAAWKNNAEKHNTVKANGRSNSKLKMLGATVDACSSYHCLRSTRLLDREKLTKQRKKTKQLKQCDNNKDNFFVKSSLSSYIPFETIYMFGEAALSKPQCLQTMLVLRDNLLAPLRHYTGMLALIPTDREKLAKQRKKSKHLKQCNSNKDNFFIKSSLSTYIPFVAIYRNLSSQIRHKLSYNINKKNFMLYFVSTVGLQEEQAQIPGRSCGMSSPVKQPIRRGQRLRRSWQSGSGSRTVKQESAADQEGGQDRYKKLDKFHDNLKNVIDTETKLKSIKYVILNFPSTRTIALNVPREPDFNT
ncbi:hypothetical protein M5K25_025665 [Dendrobium thyrsiflorum]|uniref:Uncharacterized protein n=1 Tax=Dendrobium thyrsiflorum TaxID=117978 RepID=A0ABD0U9P7_DENTH